MFVYILYQYINKYNNNIICYFIFYFYLSIEIIYVFYNNIKIIIKLLYKILHFV